MDESDAGDGTSAHTQDVSAPKRRPIKKSAFRHRRCRDAVCCLNVEVLNGGFDQFFFNSAGDAAALALSALEEMGAHASARLLRGAMQPFPGGHPPADRDRRLALLEDLQPKAKPVWDALDEKFYEMEEDLEERLVEFARQNKARFVFSSSAPSGKGG